MLYLEGAYLVGFQTQKALFLGTQKNFYRNLILNLLRFCQCHYKVSSIWGQEPRHVLTHSKVQVLSTQEVHILLQHVTVLILTADMFKRFYLEQVHIYLYFKYDII